MKKLKTRLICSALALALTSSAALFGGCSGKPSDTPGESADVSTAVQVDYVFRELNNKYITPASAFAGGTGTEEDPYQISNAAELAYLSELINSEEATAERRAYQTAHYILTEDIVLNEHPDGDDWSKKAPEFAWKPIGLRNDFSGVFDGGGHVISGMFIDEDCSDKQSNRYSYGFIGHNSGMVMNLRIDKSYVCVSGYATRVGTIAGENSLEDDSVKNCSAEAAVYCYDAQCGGIVGMNGGTASDCQFSGSVNALREKGDVKLGGIAGYNSGTIDSCQSNASVVSAESGLSQAGGIAGSHHGGVVSNCTNDGEISGAHSTGGIAGNVFLANIGGDMKATQSDIKDCVNNGSVKTNDEVAGGIAGELCNDHSEYTAAVTGCENNGKVEASKKNGGIIGLLTSEGNVTVSGCINKADLDGETAGGIIASATLNYGDVDISGNENNGKVKAKTYAAGIVAESNVLGVGLSGKSLSITYASCVNKGAVETDYMGGGITGTMICTLKEEDSKAVTVSYKDDRSSADILCNNSNAFIGGIAGNLGLPYGKTTVTGCAAEGSVTFKDIAPDEETVKLEKGRMEFARMSGGIVGRIGAGLYLSTTGEKLPEKAGTDENANIRIESCYSTITFDAPDESKYTYSYDGKPIFLNRFGGIIGCYSGDDGFDYYVTGSEYANAERGLGNEELTDVGTKTDEASITSKINK